MHSHLDSSCRLEAHQHGGPSLRPSGFEALPRSSPPCHPCTAATSALATHSAASRRSDYQAASLNDHQVVGLTSLAGRGRGRAEEREPNWNSDSQMVRDIAAPSIASRGLNEAGQPQLGSACPGGKDTHTAVWHRHSPDGRERHAQAVDGATDCCTDAKQFTSVQATTRCHATTRNASLPCS